MEEKKNNQGIIWLIIILIILVLGLVGYIVYDKVLKSDNSNNNTSSTTITTSKTTEKENGIKNVVDVFKSLPQENDNTALWSGSAHKLVENYIDFNTDFKNISKNEYGFDLNFNCVEYDEKNSDENIDKCTKFEIYINKKQNNLYSNFWYNLDVKMTNSYFITYDGGFGGNLRIFDKSGNEIYTEYIATDFGIKIDEENYNDEIYGYTPTIKDNKLYFVKYLKENEENFIISSFDFNTKKVEEILKFKGEIGII